MRIKLVKAQRYACIATAWVIVLFQLLTFAQEGGIFGHDWAYSIIIAAGFGLLGTRPITGAWGYEGTVDDSGAARPAPAATASATAWAEAKDSQIEDKDAPSEDTNTLPIDEGDDPDLIARDGSILAREVTARARRIISTIPRPANPEARTEDEIWANRAADLEYSRLRELAFMLCLGLVAVRRSGKDENYLKAPEYLEMQYVVFLSLAEDVTTTFEQIGCPMDITQMTNRLELDFDDLRGCINQAIAAAALDQPGRAKPVIDWAKSGGLVVSDVSLIKNALMTVEEWNSDSPVNAYPA